MKIAIAKAFNAEYYIYKKYAKELGMKVCLFDIDNADWQNKLPEADFYFWHSDDKEHNYRIIHDRVYFIENIMSKKIFPDMKMYFSFNDKIKQIDMFKYHKIPHPKTRITYKKEEAVKIINNIKYPFVLKDAHGYGGKHVYKIENKKQAKKMIEKIFSKNGYRRLYCVMKNYFFAQDFLQIDRDLRVIVIGNKIACAYWRLAAKREWKNNISRGASYSFENIPKKVLKFCLDFNKKMGFHWMAYDIFVTKNGKILFNELSCNFGVKAPKEKGYQIRKMQIQYIKDYFLKK